MAFCGPDERALGAKLLRMVAGRAIAVLVATRDAAGLDALGLADRTLRLERGRVVATSRADAPGAPRIVASPDETRAVLELSVPSPEDAMSRLASRLPSLARRGRRLRVPLAGSTPEAILALCRDAGVRVRGSRVAEEASPLPVPRAGR